MIDLEDGSIFVHSIRPKVIRRDTNTILIQLNEDEVLALIAGLASCALDGTSIYLTVEKDNIYIKDRE